jgi:hypothetical protein
MSETTDEGSASTDPFLVSGELAALISLALDRVGYDKGYAVGPAWTSPNGAG